MNEHEQHKAIELLQRAWTTVDYWDHNGALSVEIANFIQSVKITATTQKA